MKSQTPKDKLIVLYQEMSDLTAPCCGRDCGTYAKYRCCSPEYCEMAIETAKEEWNTDLPRTDHPTLPLMQKDGSLGTCMFGGLTFRGRVWAVPIETQSAVAVMTKDSKTGGIPIFLEPAIKGFSATVLGVDPVSSDVVDTKKFFRVRATQALIMPARTNETPVSQQGSIPHFLAIEFHGVASPLGVSVKNSLSMNLSMFSEGTIFFGVVFLDIRIGGIVSLPTDFGVLLPPEFHADGVSFSPLFVAALRGAVAKACIPIERLFAVQTDHEDNLTTQKLKFQPAAIGCTVAPHFRPLCTLHNCDINGVGCKKNDPNLEWTEKYFKIRTKINRLELKLAANRSISQDGRIQEDIH